MTLQAVIPFAQFIERATVDENPEVLASVTDAQTHQTPFDTSIQAQTSKFLYALENYPLLSTAAALTQALIDANGARVTLQPGKIYTFAAPSTATNIPVDLDTTGAFLQLAIGAANAPILTITQNVTLLQNVTLAPGTFDFGAGTPSDVTTITVANGALWAVGDTMKILSDDLLPQSDPALRERMADVVTVGAIVGNLIYAESLVRENMVTNVRACKMNQNKVRVRVGDWSNVLPYPVARNTPMLQVFGAVEPVVEIADYMHDAPASAIFMNSCHKPRVFSGRIERLRTSTANNADGYGVGFFSCTDAVARDINGSDLRHLVTGGTYGSDAGQLDVFEFGACIECVGINIVGDNCLNGALDWHPDALRCGYIGSKSTNSRRGQAASYYQTTMRGRDCYLKDCVLIGCGGINVVSDFASGYSFLIEGCLIIRPIGYTQSQGPIRIDGGASSRPIVFIKNTHIISNVTTTPGITSSFADVYIDNLTDQTTFSGASYRTIEATNSSQIRTKDLRAVWTANGGTNPRIARTTDAASSVRTFNTEVDFAASWVMGDALNFASTIVHENVRFTTPPNTATGGWSQSANATVFASGPVSTAQTATGTTQADALKIVRGTAVFSTVAAGTGSILPLASAVGIGNTVTIFNDGANPLKVYAVTGDTIDGAAAATGVTLTNALRCEYEVTSATAWKSAQLGAASA